MQRRVFLRSSATAGLAFFGYSLGVEPWQRLGAALAQPSRLDQTIIDNLETVTVTFAGLFPTAVPAALINPVRSHLETLAQLLDGATHPEHLRRQLISLASETAVLLGWITKDLGDHGTAQQYFLTAISAAAEADDRPLGAYAVASASTLPAFRHNAGQTIHLLTGAEIHGVRAAHATGATRAYVHTLKAEAHSRAHDERSAFAALERAAGHLGPNDDGEPIRPRVAFFDETRFLAERGIVAVRLGNSAEARDALTAGLTKMAEDRRIRSRFLANLATAHLQNGDIDQACDTALDAFHLTRRSNTQTANQELRAFRQQLDQWRNTDAVHRLDEQLESAEPHSRPT